MQYFIIYEKVFILFRYRGLTNDFCARSKVDRIILRLSMHRITIRMVHRLIEDGAIIMKTSNRLASCKIRPYLARMLAAHHVLVHFCSCQSARICSFPCAGFPRLICAVRIRRRLARSYDSLSIILLLFILHSYLVLMNEVIADY